MVSPVKIGTEFLTFASLYNFTIEMIIWNINETRDALETELETRRYR